MAYQRKQRVVRKCDYCQIAFFTQYDQKRYCSSSHRQRHRWERVNLIGVDKVQCLDCGKWFIKLGSHVVQAHGYETAKEYRIEHKLNPKRGIVPDSHREQLAENVRSNGTIENLKQGAKYRFVKGDGRASKIVTEYWNYRNNR